MHEAYVHDVFEENGTAYYVMEHLSGGSLSDKVHDNGPLSEDQCIDYICQVSSALDYLHGRNTLHFDVKPSNILFDEDGRAVLVDFGISKHYDTGGHQTSNTPIGLSKGYAPLEQYRQDDVSTFTPSTDIYSLGATLYNLATGMIPPDASIVNEEGLERPLGISDRLWNTIERSMQPRRKDRPQSIKEFMSLLEGTGGTEDDTTIMYNSKSAEPQPSNSSGPILPPDLEPCPKAKRRFPKWLYGVAATLLLGLIEFQTIPKSKPVKDTPASGEPVQGYTVTDKSQPVKQQSTASKSSSPSTGTCNGYEWIDLGLSVKWATCNIGASKPEEFGDYYAWGETSTKSNYTWENYRFRISGNSSENVKFSKYNTQSDRGTVDNRTVLEMSDDIARQKWGGGWRIPTKEEFQELIDNCIWTWSAQVGGYKVTSKKSGYTDCFIFLPASGCLADKTMHAPGSHGFYWYSSLNTSSPYFAWDLCIHPNVYSIVSTHPRYYGFSIRPVCQ